jgi:membrane-associated phospholipid phosphatase
MRLRPCIRPIENVPCEATQRQLIAWPGWKHVGEAVWLGVLFGIWLEVAYGLADYLTALRSSRVRVHFDWELAIPFVPSMTVFYVSVLPLMWLAPFTLRTRSELRALVAALSRVTLFAGIGFLLLPAQLAYAPQEVPTRWAWLYNLADTLNLHYNLAPSLHVALAVACIDAYTRRGSGGPRLVLWAWGVAIALSTLLTHQHHLLDVVSGFLLAMVVSRWSRLRTLSPPRHHGSLPEKRPQCQ